LTDDTLDGLRGRFFGRGGPLTGQAIAIEILSGPWRGEYDTRVTGADTERLFLALPLLNGEPVKPDPGTPLRAAFRNHFGSFRFMGTVVSDELLYGHCIVITMPAELRRMQRRGHVRLPVSLPIRVMRLPDPAAPPREAPSFLEGTTVDVGGGGLSFSCPGLGASPGDLVSVLVAVPEAARRVQATCEVVWVAAPDGTVAVRFSDIDERARWELDSLVSRAYRRARASELAERLREQR